MIFELFSEVRSGLITGKMAGMIFIIILLSIALSLTFHEFAHAFVAYKFGDDTPKAMGRLTLNPFKHIDPMGFVMLAVVGIGWAKPVPTNPLNYKKFKTGRAWVSVAGAIANYILMIISLLISSIIVKIGFASEFLEYLYLKLLYNESNVYRHKAYTQYILNERRSIHSITEIC